MDNIDRVRFLRGYGEVHTSLNKERELYFPKNGSEKLAENEFNYVVLLLTLSDKYHFYFWETRATQV